MKSRAALVLIMAPFLGAACEGVTQDPRHGGLTGGICGITQGTYGHRIEQRRRELDDLDDIQRRLQQELSASQTTIAALDAAIAEQKQRIEREKADLAALDAEIEQLKQRRDLSSAEKQRVTAEYDALSREFAEIYDANAEAEETARVAREGGTENVAKADLAKRTRLTGVRIGKLHARLGRLRHIVER